MEGFLAGFGRTVTTPMMGIAMDGYYEERKADGVLDELEANALAVSFGDSVQVIVTLDLCTVSPALSDLMRETVSRDLNIDVSDIHIAVTHSHTTAAVAVNSEDPLIRQYTDFVITRVRDAVKLALDDRKPARLGWGVGNAPGISFKRRFRMKDGTVRTNPGVHNPDIAYPIGDVDENVGVLRIDQEGGKHLVLVNFANHADTIGGTKISADWPGRTRRMVEKTLENTRCILVNGAEGDVGHVNVHPGRNRIPGQNYRNVIHMGNVLTGAVLQVYDKVTYNEVTGIKQASKILSIPSHQGDPARLPEARRIKALYEAGRESELPYTGMELVTVVAEAIRMVNLENGPDHFEYPMTAFSFGNIGIVTIPGEAFAEIGLQLKATPGWDTVLVFGETDGCGGYYPTTDAYEEGGYEARSSRFAPGVGDLLLESGRELLRQVESPVDREESDHK